jgi:hypothetical protein
MPKNDNDNDSVFGIPILIVAVIIVLFILFFMYNFTFARPACPACPACPCAASSANANIVVNANNKGNANANTASFADGVVASTANSDACAAFGGAPDLEDPGVMFDQHPLIEFCVTNCNQYVDAVNRAAAEDAALSDKIVSDPDNSLWEMRQQYYTIYLEALGYVGQDLGCLQ